MIACALSRTIWSRARWLVIAPHPDDETLGAGALVAETAREGRLGGIVYLTNGGGSHPPDTVGLLSARRREAQTAVRRLAGKAIAIDRFGWQDGQPHRPESSAFRADATRLSVWLRDRRIDAVAVSDEQEHHCDHVAAYRLAREAIRLAHRSIALFSYHVWGEPPARDARRYRTASMAPGRRRHALCAHRSQLSPLFGHGFRLDRAQQNMPATDLLTLRRPSR